MQESHHGKHANYQHLSTGSAAEPDDLILSILPSSLECLRKILIVSVCIRVPDRTREHIIKEKNPFGSFL